VSRVGIIYKGKILFQGALPELHSFQQKDAKLFIKTSDNEAAYTLLRDYQPERIGETLALSFVDMNEVAAINRTLTKNDLDVYLLNPKENDLEQLFINLTTDPS
jgi:lantibiotic transport system ATP-binding protein